MGQGKKMHCRANGESRKLLPIHFCEKVFIKIAQLPITL